MTDHDISANRFFEGYAKAVLDRDLDGFMKLYDPKVRVFDAWGVWSYEGHDAFRKPITEWFAMTPDEHVRVGFDDARTFTAAGLMTVSAFINYASVASDGKVLRGMKNRITWVIAGSGDDAKIVHEHTSAPIGFEDGKAILS